MPGTCKKCRGRMAYSFYDICGACKLKAATAEKEKLVDALRAAGVLTAEIAYDGSGDSGSVDSEGVYSPDPSGDVAALNEQLSEFASTALEAQDIDWYNNEGGFGRLVVDVKAGTAVLEHNHRIESSEEDFRTL